MFNQHNKYTKLTYIILGLNSIVGVIFLWMFVPTFASEQPMLMWILLVVLTLVLAINVYLAFRIYKQSLPALKWALWLYILQIISFESENWAFGITFGMQFTLSWEYEGTSVAFNLMAIVIALLSYKAYRSVSLKD